MRRWVWISSIVVALLAGCSSPTKEVVAEPKPAPLVAPPSVALSIQPQGPQTSDHWKYTASFTKNGKTSRFGVEFMVSKTSTQGLNVKVGRGSFIAIPHSDGFALLAVLKQVLKAKQDPSRDVRVRELPFDFLVQGENLDRGPSGTLVDSATGKWVSTKLSLGTGGEQGSLLFNFERGGGKGEFAMDEASFGDLVLKELAKVL